MAKESKTKAKANAKRALAKEAKLAEATEGLKIVEESNRVANGVLASHPDSKDIKIESFSLSYYSQILISETNIELNFGRRYGVNGPNGCGKSTFLECLAAREVPIPDHMDIFLLNGEYPPTEMTALEAVIADAQTELERLEKLMEDMMVADPDSPFLDDLFERIESMDSSMFESKAGQILHGLGFTADFMKKKTSDLSGGWRMRVALARALFVRPTLLLLDQPTNHLDLGAVVWLEEYLKTYDRILVIISHSEDFLNAVCTNIIDINHKKELVYYSGNYDSYVQTKKELDVNQTKAYDKQQTEIKDMKKFISTCGTYSNLVKQAKSRQKILDKMEAAGLVEKVEDNKKFNFSFQGTGPLPPPVLAFTDVGFAWSGVLADCLYRHLELGVDTESRIALVGPNGAGKSTLLKLMNNELSPTEGSIARHAHLRMQKYSQHSSEQLDQDMCAIDYLRKKFPDEPQDMPYWRGNIGRFGLTGSSQLCPIGQLSDGQKSRIVFCELSLSRPSMLLLDEPTNALDIETIDSLADAINEFKGGVVLVSHDFRLISQVAKEIWLCEDGKIKTFEGSISDYKKVLRDQTMKANKAFKV